MPLLLVLFAILVLLAMVVITMPIAIIGRYRMGTARRPAHGWIAGINLVAASLSAIMLLTFAAVSNVWIPRALLSTAGGMGAGLLLGLIGLLATRWETTPRTLHYTPSRLLVLTITIVVAARLGYGFWRMWTAWQETPDAESWVAASGAAGSMGAGAVVLGYYLVFWAGVYRRVNQHRRLTRQR